MQAKTEPLGSAPLQQQTDPSSLPSAADAIQGDALEAQGDNEQPMGKQPSRAAQHKAGTCIIHCIEHHCCNCWSLNAVVSPQLLVR